MADTINTYRQVKDETIVNRIVTDGELPADFFEYDTYELETEDPPPQIGWTFNGSEYIPPPPEVEIELPMTKPGEEMLPPPSREEFNALEQRVAALEASAKETDK